MGWPELSFARPHGRDGRGVAVDRARALELFDKACKLDERRGCDDAAALRERPN